MPYSPFARGAVIGEPPVSTWSATPWVERYRSAARLLAELLMAASLLVLVGWAVDAAALKGIKAGFAVTKVNSAIAMFFGGLAVVFALQKPRTERHRLKSELAASVLIFIGAATLTQYVFGVDLGIDQLLIRDSSAATSFPGRPAPVTAILFLMLGAAIIFAQRPGYGRTSQLATFAALVITYLILVGYIYGASSLFRVSFFSAVALHTGILVMILGLATLGIAADVGIMAHVCSDTAGGVMARRLLPIVAVLPVMLGWLRRQGQAFDLYEQEFGAALFATSYVLILAGVTLWTARALSRFDAARRAAERRFELAVEAAPNAMLVTNARGHIVLTNSHAESLFGYPRGALLGQPYTKLVPERYQHDMSRLSMPQSAGDIESQQFISRDLFGRRADGSEFPMATSLSPIESQGASLNLISILDVTARTQLEEERREHLAELAHASRLSTVGQMMSELAHELNQPLAAAANYARACVNIKKAGGPTAADEIAECMEKTVSQTNRAIEIVKRIGAFAKKDTGSWASVNLNRLVENVVTLTIPTMQGARTAAPVTPRMELDESAPEVYVDRVQIEQVLVNLIRNAVEAMQAPACRNRSLVISTRRLERDVEVSVRDHGGGIAPADLAQLFTPYFTTKNDGMGLGLSISRTIVEQHHGQMTVDSTRDGTEFRFTLPIPDAPADVVRPRRPSASTASVST
jgi:PAS domain S-box-containing protein